MSLESLLENCKVMGWIGELNMLCLQPRYHIFGEGVRSAELHESTGPPGAVHAR